MISDQNPGVWSAKKRPRAERIRCQIPLDLCPRARSGGAVRRIPPDNRPCRCSGFVGVDMSRWLLFDGPRRRGLTDVRPEYGCRSAEVSELATNLRESLDRARSSGPGRCRATKRWEPVVRGPDGGAGHRILETFVGRGSGRPGELARGGRLDDLGGTMPSGSGTRLALDFGAPRPP